MNIQELPRRINAHEELVVCFDVGKDALEGYALHLREGAPDRQITLSIERKTDQIESKLNELADYADEQGLRGLCVVCEPTGGYDQELLRLARLSGHRTAYVNTEHGAKMSVIESGDTNKTDPADARALSLVAEIDRTQAARPLEGEHGLLRQLGRMYEEEDEHVVRTRTRFHHVLKQLFCDYEKRSQFLFGSTGTAVMKEYAWDPQAIINEGYDRFCQKVKNHVKQARWSTLEDLYEQAQRSAKMQWPSSFRSTWKRRLRQLWSDYKRHKRHKEQITERIEEVYRQLQERGREPAPFEEISACQLGRLIGELGPLEDFSSLTGVEKYVGLNLRRCQSGDYEGEVKITKKGRPLARKILGQMAYQLVSKNRLFAEYYRSKKEEGMPRPKAQVAVMRKLLKLIVGLYKSSRPYDRSRVFTCRSQYEGAGEGTG